MINLFSPMGWTTVVLTVAVAGTCGQSQAQFPGGAGFSERMGNRPQGSSSDGKMNGGMRRPSGGPTNGMPGAGRDPSYRGMPGAGRGPVGGNNRGGFSAGGRAPIGGMPGNGRLPNGAAANGGRGPLSGNGTNGGIAGKGPLPNGARPRSGSAGGGRGLGGGGNMPGAGNMQSGGMRAPNGKNYAGSAGGGRGLGGGGNAPGAGNMQGGNMQGGMRAPNAKNYAGSAGGGRGLGGGGNAPGAGNMQSGGMRAPNNNQYAGSAGGGRGPGGGGFSPGSKSGPSTFSNRAGSPTAPVGAGNMVNTAENRFSNDAAVQNTAGYRGASVNAAASIANTGPSWGANGWNEAWNSHHYAHHHGYWQNGVWYPPTVVSQGQPVADLQLTQPLTPGSKWLGVSYEPYGGGGAYVTGVYAGSPAQAAGIQVGDVIAYVNGVDATDLPSIVQQAAAEVEMQILSGRSGNFRSGIVYLAQAWSF